MAKQTITTPQGVALYPWLSKPDTEYNKDGEYKVNLVLSKKEAQPMIDTINEVFSEIRHGKSLWNVFLILAIIFLLIETILSAPNTKKLKVENVGR